MLANLPFFVLLVFAIATIATLVLLYVTFKNSTQITLQHYATKITLVLICWLIVQALLTINGTYNSNTHILPPKIALFGIIPTMVVIVALFVSQKGKQLLNSLSITWLTWIHVVRIPVELTLFWLYIHQAVPELMTFEGRNFDILAGITAPLIAYFGITKGLLSKTMLLVWNIFCLILLGNIVINGFLSAPTPLQQFAFNQPNIALLYFPFSWLPTFIVPVVLFAHLTAIRQLLMRK